jgi:hypothetical protein
LGFVEPELVDQSAIIHRRMFWPDAASSQRRSHGNQPTVGFAEQTNWAWTGESTEFEEFCDRASEPQAILKIEFATAIVGLIFGYAESIYYR